MFLFIVVRVLVPLDVYGCVCMGLLASVEVTDICVIVSTH